MNLPPAMLVAAERIRYGLIRGGWPGAAGLLLILAAGGLQFAILPARQAATAAARAESDRQHRAFMAAAADARRGMPDAAASLDAFLKTLPPEAEAAASLELIQQLAQRHGLSPAGTEYKWQRRPAAGLAEVRVAFSARGAYGQLRAFVRDVVAEAPSLAIEQFDLQRESLAAADAEARLRFLLYLRPAP